MVDDNMIHSDDAIQAEVGGWVRRTFGQTEATNLRVRAARLLEEALELTQTAGLTEAEAIRIVRYVFTRPIGEQHQEVGGTALTLAAFCEAAGVSMRQLLEQELNRVRSIPVEHFAERNAIKSAIGIVA